MLCKILCKLWICKRVLIWAYSLNTSLMFLLSKHHHSNLMPLNESKLLYYQMSDQKESAIWQIYYKVNKHFSVSTMVQQGKADGYKLSNIWILLIKFSQQPFKIQKSYMNSLGKLESYLQKKMKLEHSKPPYKKINSKWIKDLILGTDTLKLLDGNTGGTLFDTKSGNIFLDTTPTVMEIKTKINKWELIKL